MLKRKKKVRGIELIDEVAGRFTTMLDELDEGVEDCLVERVDIRTHIEQLNQRDAILDSSVNRAATIASNLRGLLGG